MTSGFIFLLALALVNVSSAVWSPPYLQSIHPDVDISFSNDGNLVILISMLEEIEAPVIIANFTGYTGNSAPSISGGFADGSNSNLGISFVESDSNWQVVIGRKQDYENPPMRQYLFSLNAIDGITPFISISVKNIFDVSPVITQITNPCNVPEFQEPDFTSNCIFEVYDQDGMENNTITFSSDSSEVFDFEIIDRNNSYARYSLIVKEKLDYDDGIMKLFNAKVSDIGNNTTPFNVIVYVENIPLRPPVWIRPFSSARFLEKSENRTFEFFATDGDRGINASICYKVEFGADKNYSALISIPDASVGSIFVTSINRDEEKIEIFPFNIIAYKCDTESSFISSSAVLIVDDRNDNAPEIFFDNDKRIIEIWESEISTLFQTSELSVNDIDLGINATYLVTLSPNEFSQAFSIIPTTGYQLQNFTISVVNPQMLDFDEEDELWRNFTMTITAAETETTELNTRSRLFRVILKNWNDELPIFQLSEYTFEINETIGENELIGNVVAIDRDVGDDLVYYLTGRINDILQINRENGTITTSVAAALDYERQQEVLFQAFVNDTLQVRNESTHMAFVQVRIVVLDINDTPPQLILPQGVMKITENDREWNTTIEAYDPDLNADLEFFIDWDRSSVSGSDDNELFYRDSLIITKIEDGNINRASGLLRVNPDFAYDIDYEKYHFMYIMIGVVDRNTFVNNDTTYSLMTIEVEDVNDNAPEFIGNTLTINRRVIEEAEEGVFIGSISARDVDGPGNNEITFNMTKIEGSTTPDGWLKIDESTGEITVDLNKTIDCDEPNRRDTLDYVVIISDGTFQTLGNISIIITDINNKVPQIDDFNATIELYENATNVEITKVFAHDDDRDDPHNVLHYSINYLISADFFEINSTNGEVRVRDLDDDHRMDRDNGITEHTIYINVVDNRGLGAILNSNSTTVQVILLDCNDNYPTMLDELLFSTINENLMQNAILVPNFYALDKDEGLNAQVDYKIESIGNVEFYGDSKIPAEYENLLRIDNINSTHARVYVGMNLRGFSGKWTITISATDRGSESDAGISLQSQASYEIEIEPYNFNAPVIIFPDDDEIIRIDYNNLVIGSKLTLLDGSTLPSFEAIDTDVGMFGNVTFLLNSENGDHEYFEIIQLSRSQSELRVRKSVEEATYVISLTAVDGGERASSQVNNIQIVFVNRTSDPIFEMREWTTDFTENEEGLIEIRKIPEAVDPKNIGQNLYEIYYFIDENYNPDDAKLFQLNKITGELKLARTLDREDVETHRIKIIASNLIEINQNAEISEKSTLFINIIVNDVNDNPPTFDYLTYTVGISERDNLEKTLFVFHATDPDLNDQVTYHILTETLTVSSETLTEFKDTAFALNSETGILSLNFQVQEFMRGFFSFQVQARDRVNHTHETSVKIYTVAERHRIKFVFDNTTEEVKSVNLVGLVKIFSDAYNAECINDDIKFRQLEDGTVDEKLTDYRVHFLRNDEAVEKEEIYGRSTDITFITDLTTRLQTEQSLILYDLPIDRTAVKTDSNTLEISLAIVSGILGLLLIAVIAFHIYQTRNFNRQIKALTQESFDPTSFNKKALPNTNLYSNERSNPAMMNADFQNNLHSDTKSIISNESDDFAGLENNPIFDISSTIEENRKNPMGVVNKDSFA